MRLIIVLTLVLFSGINSDAQERRARIRESQGPSQLSLAPTHVLPSVFIIPGGQIILGTTVGIGLFDVLELTSNLYLDLNSVFNVQAKVSLYQSNDFGLAVYGGYLSQSVKTQVYDTASASLLNRTITSTAFEPGVVASYRIFSRMTGHLGVKHVVRNPEIKKADLEEKSGFISGTTVNKEFTFGLNRTLALAVGGSYDLTYDIPGAGASLHIGGFQIGAHYYFNVKTGAIMPIIGGSYSTTIN
ncbi:MAG: hypothetical protein IT289_06005 [Oligoflexia bacterium]|nr:hypothetical protein [Oligoflexia bacterium]